MACEGIMVKYRKKKFVENRWRWMEGGHMEKGCELIYCDGCKQHFIRLDERHVG